MSPFSFCYIWNDSIIWYYHDFYPMSARPPYQITNKTLEFVALISERIGAIGAMHLYKPPTELRKKNRIKTIKFSLEIEGNSLTLDQDRTLHMIDRVEMFKSKVGDQFFSRKDYLQYFKNISAPTASRDLKWAFDHDLMEKVGANRMTMYHFVQWSKWRDLPFVIKFSFICTWLVLID